MKRTGSGNGRKQRGYFERVLTRWPKDGPASIFLKLCEEYIADEPSEDWEGVYVLKHK